MRRSVERSLRLLGLERLQVCYLHDPEHTTFEEATAPGGRWRPPAPQGRGPDRAGGARRGPDRDVRPLRPDGRLRGGHHPQPLHPPPTAPPRPCWTWPGNGAWPWSTPPPTAAGSWPKARRPTLTPTRTPPGDAGPRAPDGRDLPAPRVLLAAAALQVLPARPARRLHHRGHRPPGADRPDPGAGPPPDPGRLVAGAGRRGLLHRRPRAGRWK